MFGDKTAAFIRTDFEKRKSPKLDYGDDYIVVENASDVLGFWYNEKEGKGYLFEADGNFKADITNPDDIAYADKRTYYIKEKLFHIVNEKGGIILSVNPFYYQKTNKSYL